MARYILTAMPQKIRWGILAPGSIARAFVEGLTSVPDAVLAAVGSRSHERARAFADKHGAQRAFGSYEELVSDPAVDAVYVASPHVAHAEHAILAMEHGKAVLCEKPFAVSAAQGRRMVQTARAKGVFCMEAMWTRFLPTLARLRELLAQGAVGEPRMLLADFGFRCDGNPAGRLMNRELGGGALLDVGVYPISLAFMVFGAPERVSGMAHIGSTGVDEQTTVLMTYPGGRMASCTCAVRTNTPHAAVLLGTEGSIDLGRGWWRGERPLELSVGGTTRIIETPKVGNGYNYEAAEVGRCLRQGLKESPVMSLDESVRILETLDEIRRPWGLHYPGE